MARIFSNNIPLPDKRDRFSHAVLEGMDNFPDTWQASIYVPQQTSMYVEVTIEGPGTFRWTRRFTGPAEQEAGFIKETIRNGLLPFLTKKQ